MVSCIFGQTDDNECSLTKQKVVCLHAQIQCWIGAHSYIFFDAERPFDNYVTAFKAYTNVVIILKETAIHVV